METRRQQLIEDNIGLVEPTVLRIAGGFPRFVEREELMGAGRLGLTEAAINYDFERGVPFAPFATRRVAGAVLDAVRSDDWTPRRLRRLARTVDVTRQAMLTELRREPTDSEVATELGIDPSELAELHQHRRRGTVERLDRPATADGATLADQLTDPSRPEPAELLENSEMRGYLRAALVHLPERLRFIVVGYYLEGRQLDELAALLEVTPSRVSQLRADALDIIRHGIESQFTADAEPSGPTGGGTRKPGRVAVRQAQYASSIARHNDWRSRFDPCAGLPLVTDHTRPARTAVPA